MSHLEILYRF